MSVYDDIRAALEARLSTTVGVPPIAWENLDFNPTTGTGYLRVRLLHTAKRGSTVGQTFQYRYQGVFQILVCYPEGVGPGPSQVIVDTLIDRFPTGLDLTANGVTTTIQHSEQMGAYNQSPWFLTPINISWFCYSN